VTRKIARAATRIKLGLQKKLYLGNLDAQRDWGFAGDYVEAMWLMLQQDQPDDYVIAMNELYSVREFCEKTFSRLGLDYQDHVEVDPRYYRPAEVDLLLGDSTKARTRLGWVPQTSFEQLVDMMVDGDMELARREALIQGLPGKERRAA
jgi:GDPmannose 4,6-dehydratase